MHLKSIAIYPIKSCMGQALESVSIGPRGPAGDRRMMLVDEAGRFVTGREEPSLVLVRASEEAGRLTLEAPGQPIETFNLAEVGERRESVTLWKEKVPVQTGFAAADEWFSAYLGKKVRLVVQGNQERRDISDKMGALGGDEASLADGYPILAIGTASLRALNERLDHPVTMANFRPNLVIETHEPFVEDRWTRVVIESVRLRVAKPCTRCIFTTVNPATGEKDTAREPLRTLTSWRFSKPHGGVLFGMNWIAESSGTVGIGAQVYPEESQS